MSSNPLVSVVIPTYGRSDLLRRAVDSVLRQTYDNIEIIVVDDNDRDSKHRVKTEHLLQPYIKSNQVTYLKHEKNAGGSAARNTGIKVSSGEYVALLDDDDEWFSDKLEKQIEYFEVLGNETGVIYCSYILEEFDGDKEYMRAEKGDLTKKLLMLEFDPGASSTLVFRKGVLEEIGYFDESFGHHQDLEILVRLCRTHLIDVCPNILLKVHGHNLHPALKAEKVKKHFFDTFRKEIGNLSFWERRKVYAIHYMELAYLFLSERNVSQTAKYYLKAIALYPPMLFSNEVNKSCVSFVLNRI